MLTMRTCFSFSFSVVAVANLLVPDGADAFAFAPQHYYRTTTTTTTSSSTTSTSISTSTRQFAVSASAESSQLAQLASMTTLSIDSGDLKVIEEYAATGYITDATTNPLFVSQAGLRSGDPVYAKMVTDAVEYALVQESSSSSSSKRSSSNNQDDEAAIVALAIDRLAVNLGSAIAKIVPGYISTEVDPRLSFDTDASVQRGERIIAMYQEMGVPKERVLIKLAATWEGIQAAERLEQQGIQCNLTLIFSVVQAVACAQHSAHLISPFTGRILDWNRVKMGRTEGVEPDQDEGVIACREMYNYFKCHGHDTICMPASWRPSRGGAGYDLDEIQALAGTDRMTIPAPLLEKLAANQEVLPRKLDLVTAKASGVPPLMGNGKMNEKEFRYRLNMDGCGTDKLAEGIRAFIGETEKLEKVITEKVRATVAAAA
jgi:transaldolase